MKIDPSVFPLVCGFFSGNPSIPSEIPSNVGQRKFNELVELTAQLADTAPSQTLMAVLTPKIVQHLTQAALMAGAHIAAVQLLSIPGNKLPDDWTPAITKKDEIFTTKVLPGITGVRVTHVATGLSVESTSELTLDKDREKALAELKKLISATKPKIIPDTDPRTAHINKIVDEVFAKHGGPTSPTQMHAIQQRISALLNKLDLKAEIGCILMPDGQDPAEWAALISTFSSSQLSALKKLTDTGDQDAIEKFFTAALAAKKAG